MHAEEREFHARIPDARHEHGRDDHGEEENVDLAVDAEGLLLFRGTEFARGHVLLENEGVDREVDCKKDRHREDPRRKEVFGRPEEFDAAEEPEEERRIAQRRKRAAHVGDQEDEKDEGVDLARAAFVRGNERANEEHRGARRAHEVGEHGAETQEGRVHDRTTHEAAAHVNAARDRKEGAHEDEEGQIVGEENVDHLVKGGGSAEGETERNGAGRGPEERDLAEMMVPEARQKERKERDGEKNAGERNGPGKTELGTVHAFGSEGEARQKKKRAQGRPTQSRKRHDETPGEERRPSKIEGGTGRRQGFGEMAERSLRLDGHSAAKSMNLHEFLE